jgi:DNA-binding response OmpR family regulator
MKILLAEDDDALRNAFVRTLKQLGHEVSAHADGASLRAAIQPGMTVDLVWTDLAMPGDGFEVIRTVRGHLPGVLILVVSGLTDAEHVIRAMKEGADYFLPKPCDDTDLLAVLRRVEAVRGAYRDKVRAWHSFVRCDLSLEIPLDAGVAAAVASLFAKHARSFLDDAACRGLQSAVHEILLNSIEHGCLEITREQKVEALGEGRYGELVAARRADPRLAGRSVTARMTGDLERGVTIVLTDPGPGFDPQALPDPLDPENLFLPSGRGITMARLHVTDLDYSDGGRTATLQLRPGGAPLFRLTPR